VLSQATLANGGVKTFKGLSHKGHARKAALYGFQNLNITAVNDVDLFIQYIGS
jgi:hypothetical protein